MKIKNEKRRAKEMISSTLFIGYILPGIEPFCFISNYSKPHHQFIFPFLYSPLFSDTPYISDIYKFKYQKDANSRVINVLKLCLGESAQVFDHE